MAPTTPVLSAFDYRVDGATQTLTRTAGGLGNGNIEDFSSANFTLVGLGPSAIVAEALIYNRALSASEIATLASDLTMTDADTVAITIAAVNDAPSATKAGSP